MKYHQKVEHFSKEQFENEKSILRKKDPLIMIEEIQNCFEELININKPESDKSQSSKRCTRMSFSKVKDAPVEPEKLLQKLEAEIRTHISVFLLVRTQAKNKYRREY